MTRFSYKDRDYDSVGLAIQLLQDYGSCPDCGCDKVGGEPTNGFMNFDGEKGTFERGCAHCGWSIAIECGKSVDPADEAVNQIMGEWWM